MMHRLKVSLFGSFGATLDERVLRDFKTDKERALLAYLAANRDAPQPRTKLAGLLWPDLPEARARQNLSQALYSLRLLLGDKTSGDDPRHPATPGSLPFLLVETSALQLNTSGDIWVDAEAFANLLEASKNHPHETLANCDPCLGDLEAAVTLYRGDFLSAFWLRGSQTFDEWALVQRERLRRLALQALDTLAACRAARGELELALGHAWRQVEMEPLWEHAQRRLMDLLARSGRRDAALAQYEACREVLFDELGMGPEKATTALNEQIRTKPAPAHPPPGQTHNLPAALTPFVGRQAELKALDLYLAGPGCRLVTLLGPGGSGKTRLALEYARAHIEGYPDGAWLVPLAPLRSAEAIPAALAEALGLPLQEGRPPVQQLKDYLRAKRLLLVLDSHEHLLDGAHLAVEFLKEAPGVKILATSRQRLNVLGEQLFSLGGLETPGADAGLEEARRSAAALLFVITGQRARPGFDLSPGNLNSVIKICKLVNGMPLGLLLAAAWLDTFSCAEVVAEIERGLDFLSADWDDFPARQRSLRATFDYSWGLLGEREQDALRVLAVFRGGFNRQAASAVASASSHVVRTLVEKSMLGRSLAGRFGMHELLRQYAREKLGARPDDARAASEAHAAYYLGKLPGWAEALKGPRQIDVLRELDLEIGNLAAAWSWAAENGQIGRLDQGLEGLCLYFDLRTRLAEGLAACQGTLNHLPASRDTRSELLKVRISAWKAHFLRLLGRHEDAAHILKEGLDGLDNQSTSSPDTRKARALVHFELGHAILPNDRPAARDHFQICLVLYEETGDTWRQAQALAGLGLVAHHLGTFIESVEFYQRSLALYELQGDPKSIAGVLIELGHNSLRQGLFDAGEAFMLRGCKIYEQIGNKVWIARNHLHMSRLSFWLGRPAQGIPKTRIAKPIFKDLGLLDDYTFSVLVEAGLSMFTGSYEDAYRLGQEGLNLAKSNRFQRWEAFALWNLGMASMGMKDFQESAGHLRGSIDVYHRIGQRDELGWAFGVLTYSQLELETRAGFLESLCQALQLGLEFHALLTILFALPAAALYFLQQSRTITGETGKQMISRAIELYAVARRYPHVGNAQWFEDVAGERIAAAAARLPPAVAEAARERGRSQDAFAVARELLAEISPKTEPSSPAG